MTKTKEMALWSEDETQVLRNTVAKGLSDSELLVFLKFVSETNLNPFKRQIYAIKRGGGMSIQTGIDGFRSMAEDTGKYAGSDDAIFETTEGGKGLISAKIVVYKMVEGVRCSFGATAYWAEYNQPSGQMWKKMPRTMLAKCAEALALRKAFPGKLSGIYTNEEMDQADNQVTTPEPVKPATTKKTSDPNLHKTIVNLEANLVDNYGYSFDEIEKVRESVGGTKILEDMTDEQKRPYLARLAKALEKSEHKKAGQ